MSHSFVTSLLDRIDYRHYSNLRNGSLFYYSNIARKFITSSLLQIRLNLMNVSASLLWHWTGFCKIFFIFVTVREWNPEILKAVVEFKIMYKSKTLVRWTYAIFWYVARVIVELWYYIYLRYRMLQI